MIMVISKRILLGLFPNKKSWPSIGRGFSLLIVFFFCSGFSQQQLEDVLKTCLKKGNSIERCKQEQRLLVRQQKQNERGEKKNQEIESNRKAYQALMDESDPSNNIVFNVETGQYIDLSKLSFVDQERVRCLSQRAI